MKTRGAETGARRSPVPILRHDGNNWLWAWRQLATDTDGLEPDDRRLKPVLHALSICDDHFIRGDWDGFQHAAKAVRLAMRGKS